MSYHIPALNPELKALNPSTGIQGFYSCSFIGRSLLTQASVILQCANLSFTSVSFAWSIFFISLSGGCQLLFFSFQPECRFLMEASPDIFECTSSLAAFSFSFIVLVQCQVPHWTASSRSMALYPLCLKHSRHQEFGEGWE